MIRRKTPDNFQMWSCREDNKTPKILQNSISRHDMTCEMHADFSVLEMREGPREYFGRARKI